MGSPDDDYRADIARRNRRRNAAARERKFSMAVVALLGYSAFSNFIGGLVMLQISPIDAGAGFVLGVLYSLGVYRTWFKDDTRWWPVAVPAMLSLLIAVLASFGGRYAYSPFFANIALLVLVPLRARAAADLATADREMPAKPIDAVG
jgi:hypothetical protein